MFFWFYKYILMGPLLRLLGRPKVTGLEYVPDHGPVLLASNHLAVVDSFYLPLVLRRRIFFLAKAEYFTGTGVRDAPRDPGPDRTFRAAPWRIAISVRRRRVHRRQTHRGSSGSRGNRGT